MRTVGFPKAVGLLLFFSALAMSGCSGGGSGTTLPSTSKQVWHHGSKTTSNHLCPVYVSGDGTTIDGLCKDDGTEIGGGSSYHPCADDLLCLESGGGGGGTRTSPTTVNPNSCPPATIYFVTADGTTSYCESDGSDTLDFANEDAISISAILVIKFKSDHFWEQHVKCYVQSTLPEFEQASQRISSQE